LPNNTLTDNIPEGPGSSGIIPESTLGSTLVKIGGANNYWCGEEDLPSKIAISVFLSFKKLREKSILTKLNSFQVYSLRKIALIKASS
jgi:hypothetical protein